MCPYEIFLGNADLFAESSLAAMNVALRALMEKEGCELKRVSFCSEEKYVEECMKKDIALSLVLVDPFKEMPYIKKSLLSHIATQKMGSAKEIYISDNIPAAWFFEKEKKYIVLLPLVPDLIIAHFASHILPYLKPFFSLNQKQYYTQRLHLCMLQEEDLAAVLEDLRLNFVQVHISMLAHFGIYSVLLSSLQEEKMRSVSHIIQERFSQHLFFSSTGRIEEAVHDWCTQNKKTLAFAESCTGGLLASRLTALSGASKYFLGSLVVYNNAMKQKFLGVSAATLQQEGAVSDKTAQEMLNGLFSSTHADYALAVTGFLGPEGGTEKCPVGTIWIAIGRKNSAPHSFLLKFRGSRAQILQESSNALLSVLWRYIAFKILP